jgi:hypothetical protein
MKRDCRRFFRQNFMRLLQRFFPKREKAATASCKLAILRAIILLRRRFKGTAVPPNSIVHGDRCAVDGVVWTGEGFPRQGGATAPIFSAGKPVFLTGKPLRLEREGPKAFSRRGGGGYSSPSVRIIMAYSSLARALKCSQKACAWARVGTFTRKSMSVSASSLSRSRTV